VQEQEKEIIIFTDGGAIGNPGPGGFGAIVFDKSSGKVTEIGGSEKNTTNNRMEMKAVIEALKVASDGFITVYSDSKYTITGITQWIFGWQQNNWLTKNKTPVLNKDLWQELSSLVSDKEIEWKHVEGHVGIPGNERADTIANSFARGNLTNLFSGSIKDYKIDLNNFQKLEAATKANKGKKAYSYLSMVDGKIERHETWAECEARVKGKKARFKKTFSKEEEERLIESWLKGS
jgi:ribonuclease HI